MVELRRYKREELTNMTVKQLRQLIRTHNLHTTFIKRYTLMKKAELVEAFLKHHTKMLIK